jgi:hypothetical protein
MTIRKETLTNAKPHVGLLHVDNQKNKKKSTNTRLLIDAKAHQVLALNVTCNAKKQPHK